MPEKLYSVSMRLPKWAVKYINSVTTVRRRADPTVKRSEVLREFMCTFIQLRKIGHEK